MLEIAANAFPDPFAPGAELREAAEQLADLGALERVGDGYVVPGAVPPFDPREATA